MATPKNKHLSLEDRYTIQEFLNIGFTFSAIANRIHKNRRTVAREVQKHRYLKYPQLANDKDCPFTTRPPYVCNGCFRKQHCRHKMYLYEAHLAQRKYEDTLSEERKALRITDDEIAAVNEIIAPLMIKKHHSVNHIYAAHGDLLPFAKSTFYRYIDAGVFNIKNIDLPRKVRFKVKGIAKEKRPAANPKIKIGRFYRDFADYIALNPDASTVEMDTVIGTAGGKGGKCFLTLFFRKSHLMLIYLLPYKRSEYVTKVFSKLKHALGDDEFRRLFEVILTDNGTEFSDPDSIEFSELTGEKLCNVFFCDPSCSWQKGRLEKNHEYIRYILPKGTSFAGLSQDDCYLMASHINSVPRNEMNNFSPYEVSLHFISDNTMEKFRLQKIPNDDIDLSRNLFKGKTPRRKEDD